MVSARSDYENRRDEIQTVLGGLDARWNRVAAIRATSFLLLAVLTVLAYRERGAWSLGPLAGLALFVACVLWHQRLGARRAELLGLVDWYGRSLARLRGKADPRAPIGDEHLDESHPYASELDLFGHASLFAWSSHAQSEGGRRRFAQWLKEPASPEEIRLRQSAVAELRDDFLRREDMLLCSRQKVVGEALHFREWSRLASPVSALGGVRVLSFVLGLALVSTLAAWLVFGASPLWFLALAFAGYGWSTYASAKLGSALEGLEHARAELSLLRRLLVHVEDSEFRSDRLRAIHQRIRQGSTAASSRIAALERRFESHEAARNALFAPIAALVLWQIQWACSIEAWRRAHAHELAEALDAVADYEALQSLSRLAFELPTVAPAVSEGEGARMDMRGVGHPLLPECVRNDLELGGDLPSIWMISGSNMSGKSTFLRAVGVNLVLALAGGHVFAERMEFTPVALGASIHAGDSLSGGESRFAHELARLKKIASLSEDSTPVCFLLDELLHGTHSHDRRIGADAILRKLARRGALGLVSTHDLALCEITPELAGRVRNVHFQDDVVEGVASFDYRLRDGVVEQSNALRLMKAAGLVDDE